MLLQDRQLQVELVDGHGRAVLCRNNEKGDKDVEARVVDQLQIELEKAAKAARKPADAPQVAAGGVPAQWSTPQHREHSALR